MAAPTLLFDVNGQTERPDSSSQTHSTVDSSNPINFFLRRIMSTKRSTGTESSSKTQTPLHGAPEENEKPKTPSDLAASYDNISHQSVANLQEDGNGGGMSTAPLNTLLRTKLIALERLKKFGGSKSAGKGAREKDSDFPPPSWNVDEGTSLSEQDDEQKSEVNGSGADEGPGEIAVIPPEEAPTPREDAVGVVKQVAPPDSPEGDRTEPTSLARRIQILLSSVPRVSFSASSSQESPPPPPPPITRASDDSTNPAETPTVPISEFPEPNPASAALINDSKLISQLSSTSIMNGSISKGRESVWVILDRLGLARTSSNLGLGGSKGKEKAEGKQDDALKKVAKGDREVPGSEDIMLYAPLEPDDASIVEVARSEVVEVSDDEGTVVSGTSDSEAEAKGTSVLDYKTKPKDEQDNSDKKGKDKALPEKPKPVKEKIIWVPSATKISLQATWWGYRIYLPPPVLWVLNSKSMEAAKRAALLTTALKWLLDHIPTTFLPVQVRPAAMLLRRLVPFIGYIGAFIAWSWGAIRTFDRGYGVILSATWLLPVALIPGSWDESDFPKGQGFPLPPMQQQFMRR